MITKEQKKNRELFAKELETTTTPQCKGIYFHKDKACAMGIGLRLFNISEKDSTLPFSEQLKEKLGFDSSHFSSITMMNDNGAKFPEIAQYVRKLPE